MELDSNTFAWHWLIGFHNFSPSGHIDGLIATTVHWFTMISKYWDYHISLETLLCHLCYDLARIIHSFFISWWTNKMILVIAFLVFIMIISPFHISIKRLDMAQQCTKSIVHKWNFTNDLGRPSINGGCQLVHFCLTTRLLHLGILEWCHYFPSLFDISNVCEYPWKFGQAWITHLWDCKLLFDNKVS